MGTRLQDENNRIIDALNQEVNMHEEQIEHWLTEYNIT